MDGEERIRLLETANEVTPGLEELADWLENKANDPYDAMPYLDPEWELLQVVSTDGAREPDARWKIGDHKALPALRSLDDVTRRSLMLATRAARGLVHEWRRLRDEALLALIRDGDTHRMLAGTWTAGRIRLASDLQNLGGQGKPTHAWSALSALNALGIGDDALVTEYIPAGTPPAKAAYRLLNVEANTLSAVLHGEHVEQAAAGARKATEAKSTPQFERLLTGYLAAVVEQDERAARSTMSKILASWAKSPYNREYRDRSVHAVPLHIYGYLELGNRQFRWDPLQYAGEALLADEVLHATKYARGLTAAEKDDVYQPTVAFHGRCSGLNQIFREHPITAAAGGAGTGTPVGS